MSKKGKRKNNTSPVTAALASVWRVITLTLFFIGMGSWLIGSGAVFAVLLPIVAASIFGAVLYAAYENRGL